MREINIDECHHILLSIASTFDEICKRNQISYYMIGGTMLGAIRHQGFIPWDDDMDFGVERQYIPKLLKTLSEELPPHLKVRTIENSNYIFSNYLKIEDIRTEVIDHWHDSVIEMGISIDIFPLDKGMKSYFRTKCLASYIFLLILINNFLCLEPKYRKGFKRYIAMILRKVNTLSIQKRLRYIDRIIMKYTAEESDYLINYYGRWKAKEIIHKSVFGEPQSYGFENTTLTGVEDANGYLSSLYGNYMQLPPEDERSNHLNQMSYR